MPQGKGTYGSQVGRPPKKQKKYQTGGEVEMNADPFSTKNAFGVPAGEAMKKMNEKNVMEGLKEAGKASQPPQGAPPTANAQERSQTFQVGGNVLEYKEGGKVSKRKWIDGKPVPLPKAKFPKQTFKGREVNPVPLPDISKKKGKKK